MPPIERAGYVIGTVAGLVTLLATRSFLPMPVVKWMMLVGIIAALMVLAGWVQATWRGKLVTQSWTSANRRV